jgi:hypothetical protein
MINCFDKVTIPGLKERFTAAIKDGMSDADMKAVGVQVVMDYHKELHGRMQELRKSAGLKKEKYPEQKLSDKATEDARVNVRLKNDKKEKEVRVKPDDSKSVSQDKTDKGYTKSSQKEKSEPKSETEVVQKEDGASVKIKSQSKQTQNEQEEKGEEKLLEPSPNKPNAGDFRSKWDDDMNVLKGSSQSTDGKVKKMDAMGKRLQQAKADGVINEDEFNEKYDQLGKQRVKVTLGKQAKAKAQPKEAKEDAKEAKPKEVQVEAKAAEPQADTEADPQMLKDALEPWGTFKYKHPDATREQYHNIRDQLSRSQVFVSNLRAAKIDLSKLSGGGLQSNPLGIVVGAWNAGIETVALALEGGIALAQAIDRGVQAIKDYYSVHEVTQPPSDADITKAIKKAVNKALKVDFADSGYTFKQAFKDAYAQTKSMADAIQKTQEEVAKYFKVNGMDMTKGRIFQAMNVLKALATTDQSTEAVIDAIEALDIIMAEQEKANEIREAKAVIKKFIKFRKKNKALKSTYGALLAQIAMMQPTKIIMAGGDLKEFVDDLNKIMDEYGTGQGIRELTKENLNIMMDKMAKLMAKIDAHELRRLEDKYAISKEAGETTLPTFEEWMEEREKAKEFASEQGKEKSLENAAAVMDKFHEIIALQKERLREYITELENYYADEKGDAYFKNLYRTAKELLALDTSNMSKEELRDLNVVLNNVINDSDFVEAVRLLSFHDAKSKMEGVKSIPFRIRYAVLKSAQSISGLFGGMTFNDADGARFRALTIQNVSKAVNKVSRMMLGVNGKGGIWDDLNKILKKQKGDKADLINTVGVYQFLKQAAPVYDNDGNVEKTLEENFRDRVQVLVDGLKKRYEHFASEQIQSSENKEQQKAAQDTANALHKFGFIKKPHFLHREATIELADDIDTDIDNVRLSAVERELYDYINDKFNNEDFVTNLKFNSESLYGIPFEGHIFYAPQIPVRFSSTGNQTAASQIEAIGNGDTSGDGRRKLGVRASDRFRQRGKLANPEEFYYSTDALSNFVTSYYETNLAIEGGRDIKSMAYLLNSKDFRDFVNGLYNKSFPGNHGKFESVGGKGGQYHQFLDRMAVYMRDSVSPPFLHKDHRTALIKAWHYIANGATSLILNRVDQAPFQLLPNLAYGSLVSGIIPTSVAIRKIIGAMTDRGELEAMREFMRNFESDLRSSRGEETFDELRRILDNYKGLYKYALKVSDITGFANILGKTAMKRTDRFAYMVGALAAYIDAETKAGRIKSANDFSFSTPVANELSVSHALNVAELINNASKASERAPITRTDNTETDAAWLNAVKNVFYLKGFSINAQMGMINNAKIAMAMGGRATMLERKKAWLKVAGFAAQLGVYNYLKFIAIKSLYDMAGAAIVEKIFDLEGDDETKEKRKAERERKFWFGMLSDFFFGALPTPLETLGKMGVNEAFALSLSGIDRTKTEYDGTIYDNAFKPYPSTETTGVGSFDVVGSLGEQITKGFTDSKRTDLTDEGLDALEKTEAFKAFSIMIGQGDFLKASYSMERAIIDAAKKKSYSPPPKSRSEKMRDRYNPDKQRNARDNKRNNR